MWPKIYFNEFIHLYYTRLYVVYELDVLRGPTSVGNLLNLLQGIGMIFVFISNLNAAVYTLHPLGMLSAVIDGFISLSSFGLCFLGMPLGAAKEAMTLPGILA